MLLDIFFKYGLLLQIQSNNRPQFFVPFKMLRKMWGIQYIPRSSYNPLSNGLTETGVKFQSYSKRWPSAVRQKLPSLKSLPICLQCSGWPSTTSSHVWIQAKIHGLTTTTQVNLYGKAKRPFLLPT